MRDGIVLEGAQNMDERIDVAQTGEEVGLFEGFLADGGDIDVFDGGVGGLLWGIESGELVEALVGHACDTDVGLARVGVAVLLKPRAREDLEQRSLADLR